MVWHPDHLDDNGVTGTGAFPSADLKGTERYLSVDRSDLHEPGVMWRFSRYQREKALEKPRAEDAPPTMEKAVIVELECDKVRSAEDHDKVRPFLVKEESEGHYRAHCGIHNASGKKGKSYLNNLRLMLLGLIVGQHDLNPSAHERVGPPEEAEG